jgi:hypothetical protein
MRWSLTFLVLGGLFLAPASALAQAGGHASVLSGKVLGSGTVVHGQFGWPGISATLLTSGGPKVDFGGKVSFNYGYEGMTRYATIPGLKAQGILRLMLLEKNKFNLGLRFSPGLFVYFPYRDYTVTGLTLPVDLAAGIRLTPELMVNFGVDMPLFVAFGPYGGASLPFLVGAGIEYAIDRALGVSFNLRAGPSAPVGLGYYYPGGWCSDRWGDRYRCGDAGYGASTLEAQIGLLYKL